MAARTRRRRPRGSIDELPSGALRVRVYAGVDPLTKKQVYLQETIPSGPKAENEAEKTLTRLLNQVDEKRHPRTSATVNQQVPTIMELCDRYEVAASTAHRAIQLLKDDGLIKVSRGRRAVVA